MMVRGFSGNPWTIPNQVVSAISADNVDASDARIERRDSMSHRWGELHHHRHDGHRETCRQTADHTHTRYTFATIALLRLPIERRLSAEEGSSRGPFNRTGWLRGA